MTICRGCHKVEGRNICSFFVSDDVQDVLGVHYFETLPYPFLLACNAIVAFYFYTFIPSYFQDPLCGRRWRLVVSLFGDLQERLPSLSWFDLLLTIPVVSSKSFNLLTLATWKGWNACGKSLLAMMKAFSLVQSLDWMNHGRPFTSSYPWISADQACCRWHVVKLWRMIFFAQQTSYHSRSKSWKQI